MIKVTVTYGDNSLTFAYASQYLMDAMTFARNCLETSEKGTAITIIEEED